MKNIVKCAGLLAITVGHFAEAANISSKIKELEASAKQARSKVVEEAKANASAAAKALAEERKPKQVTIKNNIPYMVILTDSGNTFGSWSSTHYRNELSVYGVATVDIPSTCNPS